MFYKFYDENGVLILGENEYVPDGTTEITEDEYNSILNNLITGDV